MISKRLSLLALTLCLGVSGCSSVINASREAPIDDYRGTRTFGSKIDDSLIETKVSVNIAKANPDVLVIARMDRRRFPADDHEKKLAFLRSDPVTRNMDAVKNNRIVIMDASAMESSVRLFDGIEQLAQATLAR